jgi:hypothetical protein
MVKQEPLEAVRITVQVTRVLEKLGVSHIVCGSLASSVHGLPRATNDVDIVAVLEQTHIAPLVSALSDSFYIDADMIADAITHRTEFNLIELQTMFKIDVFVPLLDIVTRRELSRGQIVKLDEVSNLSLRFATPEDTVAHKLRWHELGGRVSAQQWLDAIGVLVVQRGKLDLEYLHETCELLNVAGLLTKALAEAEAEEA